MAKEECNDFATMSNIIHRFHKADVSAFKNDEIAQTCQIVLDAINSSLNGIIITNLAGKIVYVNRSFLQMFDYSTPEEALGRDGAHLFASAEINEFSDVGDIINNVKGDTEEFLAQTKGGVKFYVEVKVSNVRNKDEQIVGKMAFFIDITDKKKIELNQQALIEKLQKASEQIKVLQGIIPICAHCKNIRNDKGYYEQIEAFLHNYSGVDFSHTICPDCLKKYYPEFFSQEQG